MTISRLLRRRPGELGRRFSRIAATPSRTSGPSKPRNSSPSEVSKIGPAWRSQLFSAYLVQRIALCEPGGEPARPPSRAVSCSSSWLDAQRHQADPLGLLAGQRLAGQQVVLGLGHAAQQRPDDRRVVAGRDAEPGVPVDDPGVRRGDRHVGEQADDQPGADRRALDRRHDRLRAVDDVVDEVAGLAQHADPHREVARPCRRPGRGRRRRRTRRPRRG